MHCAAGVEISHTDTQTHRHTDTQTHKHTNTQTHKHTNTPTHEHTNTQTHKHTHTRGRQDLGRQGETLGRGGMQWETMGQSQWKTYGGQWEAMGEDNERQEETRPWEAIQHRHTCGETMGDNGRQREKRAQDGKACTPSNKRKQEGVQWETGGDKTLWKADTPSNRGKQEGAQEEIRPSGRQTQHPTKGNKKGYNGRQRGTRPSGR